MINILLVDDHELVRMGIAGLLAGEAGLSVAGFASTGEEAIKLVDYLNPDVVLLDVNMPGMGGVETCRKLLDINPDLRILMLTVHADGSLPSQLLALGAKGYLSKNCSHGELIEAIGSVARGERYLGRDVARNITGSGHWGTGSPFSALSFREMQVVMFILQGKDTQTISSLLNIGMKTINTYRRRAFDKLQVRNEVELTTCAARYGLQAT